MGGLDGKRILVVDDEIDVSRLVAFELPECEVDVAVSFEEAEARFAASGYDLVILDIMGVNGFELLRRFAARVPCIMLTAHALQPKHLERSMREGAVLYLPKAEIGGLKEYVARALGADEPLWPWLFRALDFRRWFGPGFRPPGAEVPQG